MFRFVLVVCFECSSYVVWKDVFACVLRLCAARVLCCLCVLVCVVVCVVFCSTCLLSMGCFLLFMLRMSLVISLSNTWV